LIAILENTYKTASSEKDFYKKLQFKKIELYSRNNTIVGVKLRRKFRFKTLGYDKSILQELNKNLTQNKRLNALKRIRQHQQNQEKQQSKGRERTRKRGH
tara:strand:- start:13953 stop:14252 length:300 start_codon:yes stop_codon:yes gene_type:complete